VDSHDSRRRSQDERLLRCRQLQSVRSAKIPRKIGRAAYLATGAHIQTSTVSHQRSEDPDETDPLVATAMKRDSRVLLVALGDVTACIPDLTKSERPS
jgi:hypothetical protein